MSISVGPVQEFIATARRSRDLWFGSWLLSELSKAAALAIIDLNGGQVDNLIFPAPKDKAELQSSDYNVVNKLLAIVDKPPKDVGQAVRDALKLRLTTLRKEAYQHVRKWPSEKQDIAAAQVDDLIELFWAVTPIGDENDPTAYQRARTRVESLLMARKATRDFRPVTWGDHVPKSSLDGQRESVIPEDEYPNAREDSKEKQREKVRSLWRNYGVREGERLCGVGLLKRHGRRNNDERFFSTSHVAALPLISRLKEKDKPAVEKYVKALRRELKPDDEGQVLNTVPHTAYPNFDRHDGHLLFKERLAEFFSDEEDGQTEGGSSPRKRVEKALHDFLEGTFGKNAAPKPYYALLHADGDQMGVAIDQHARDGPQSHRKLSRCLSDFAQSARGIVEKHKGSLVYSGGDDVLAFLPLHTALHCALDLAEEFKEALKGFPTGEIGQPDNPSAPTLSVGVAVAHHLDPLSDALRLARESEKSAKSVKGKNSLAVTVSKRSGVDRTVAEHWGTLDKQLDWFIYLHRAEKVPDGAAYELLDLVSRLAVPETHSVHSTLQAAMRFEAIRILERKKSEGGKNPLAEKVLNKLAAYIDRPGLKPQESIKQLAGALIVARVFADATEQANITVKELEGDLSAEFKDL